MEARQRAKERGWARVTKAERGDTRPKHAGSQRQVGPLETAMTNWGDGDRLRAGSGRRSEAGPWGLKQKNRESDNAMLKHAAFDGQIGAAPLSRSLSRQMLVQNVK